MIKQIYVCECDICGAVEKAKAVNAYRNDTEYQMPNDWTHGKNSEICICPTCSAKLNGSKTYPVIAGDPISVVYGCPAAHEEGYTTTIGTGVTVDPIIISTDTPVTKSQVVLDTATSESSVLDYAR